jgi:hypothetical protein
MYFEIILNITTIYAYLYSSNRVDDYSYACGFVCWGSTCSCPHWGLPSLFLTHQVFHTSVLRKFAPRYGEAARSAIRSLTREERRAATEIPIAVRDHHRF